MDCKLFLFLILLVFIFLGDKLYEGYVNYPDFLHDCKDSGYYKKINDKVLTANRLPSYRSYENNKDLYSLNSSILKDKKCDPNGMPTSFFLK